MKRNKKIRIDVISLVRDLGYEYREKGKNIMRNFIGLRCFVCSNDPSHHLNIRRDGWFALCFRCGLKIDGTREIVELLMGRGISSKEFLQIIRKYKLDGDKGINETVKQEVADDKYLKMLKEWESFGGLRRIDIEYLKKRGITEEFARRWGLRGGKGKYLFYVMVPVRDLNGRLEGFVGRDITGKAEKKYLNAEVDLRRNLFGLYECLKGISEDRYVLLVEGVFDVLKGQQGGINAVGLMGKVLGEEQLLQLLQVKRKEGDFVVIVGLDADVEEKEVEEMCVMLSCYFDKIYWLKWDGVKDLGDMNAEKIKELRKKLKDCGCN